MKTCTQCKEEKPISEFNRLKISRDGKRPECKICNRESSRQWSLTHPEKGKKTKREWYEKNRDESIKRTRDWVNNNCERSREYFRIRQAKLQSTPRGNLDSRMSRAINHALKGRKSGRKWEFLVDYTVDELRKHLEAQFTAGMCWGNIGAWHIDHIIPISAFNFQSHDDPDFKQCWSLKNLRPLWATDNIKKHNKIERPFQPSLAMAY